MNLAATILWKVSAKGTLRHSSPCSNSPRTRRRVLRNCARRRMPPLGGRKLPELPRGPSRLVGAHLGEEDHVADRGLVGQQHDQAIDADALARRRRHAVFEGAAEVFVVIHRLFVAGALGLDLVLEAGALV